jgi:hypothetical protein
MVMRKSMCAPLVVLGVLALLPAAPTLASTTTAAEEAHVIAMVNATRAGQRLGALQRNEKLVQMAQGQAARMAAKGSIFHNLNLGAEATSLGLIWHYLGENVGVGWNVDVIEEALLQSPHHYENIVRPDYNAIGVGVAHSGDKVFVAQEFGALDQVPKVSLPIAAPEPAAPVRAPAPVATVAPRTPIPPPAPTPIPPQPEPNALVGGIVSREAVSVGIADQRHPPSRLASVGSLLAHVLDALLPG